MNNYQFVVICGLAIFALIGVAELLAIAHTADRSACIAAGYQWSPTKDVCVVTLKK